jgi:signal transduction histidine kinase
MSLFFGQIISLLTTQPGNLIYHIVLVFSIAGALLGSIRSLRSNNFPQNRRTVFGLGILLGLQMIMFLFSALTRQGLVNPQTGLPALDRTITLLMLIWIIWIWSFPEPVRLADVGTLLLSLLCLAAFGLTLLLVNINPPNSFNLSGFEIAWQAFSLLIAMLGILVLVLRKPNGWSNGLAMLVLAFIGHFGSLIFPVQGSFPGFVRLTQIAMFPLLLTLSQRFQVAQQVRVPIKVSTNAEEPIQERRRYSTDPKTFHALITLASESDPGKIEQAITRGIAQAMLADLCFLILIDKEKNLSIKCGYDLIREETLKGTDMERESVPLLANAVQRGKHLRLPASSTSLDLKGLGKILNLSNPGNLLNVPISMPGQEPVGSILILSPYSNRLWSAEDQTYLSNVSSMFIPILTRSETIAGLQAERDKAVQDARNITEETAEEKKKIEQMAGDLDGQRERMARSQLHAENMAALLVAQEESQKVITRLKTENEQLRKDSGGSGEATEQLDRELRQTLEEMAHLQNALADASLKILDLEERPKAPITSEQIEVIASISQELRQPMSSIVGYTDLLLGESVGILADLQRKFIERIKSSTERIGSLVDDLIQVTNIETGKVKIKPESIDLNLIIDNAMAYTSTQIREKNITLRLDLSGTELHIQTDRDALQQTLIHLLQNATQATRPEGNIILRIQMQIEDDNYFLSIQVTDSGGGIANEDLPRVFSRRYRAEHSLIEGLGDTGVGLSIAKSLIEAQNGRIWVETEAGVGSTFSVLMPVELEAIEEKPQ